MIYNARSFDLLKTKEYMILQVYQLGRILRGSDKTYKG